MAKRKKRIKKHVLDGITFDSKTELNHYKILKDNPNVEILDTHKSFILQGDIGYIRLPSFKEGKLRKMQYTPDFILKVKGIDKPIAMETKGFAREGYRMRKKLFIKLYEDEYYFYECKGKKSEEKLKKDLEKMVKEE